MWSMAGKSAPMPQSEGVVTGLQVRLLGPVEVVRDGHRVRLPGAKPAALLALLAIHVGEVVGTDRLADGLWGDRPPRSSAAVLRTYVAQLRRVLGAAAVETRPGGYALRLDRVCVDARVFEQQLAQARTGHPGRPEVRSAQLRRALARWRGAAFGELASEAFAVAEAQPLEELRWVALEDRVDADLATGAMPLSPVNCASRYPSSRCVIGSVGYSSWPCIARVVMPGPWTRSRTTGGCSRTSWGSSRHLNSRSFSTPSSPMTRRSGPHLRQQGRR